MKKKYSCDRSTTTTRLEDLLQDTVVSDDCLHWYTVSRCTCTWSSQISFLRKCWRNKKVYQDDDNFNPRANLSIYILILFVFIFSQQEEKEQLNEFRTLVTGLNKRAKSIIQLKPRNPTTSIKGKLPIQAVCDFKQQEVRITIHRPFSFTAQNGRSCTRVSLSIMNCVSDHCP